MNSKNIIIILKAGHSNNRIVREYLKQSMHEVLIIIFNLFIY